MMNSTELAIMYAENIKSIRLSRKLSQERLAEMANLSTAYISELENHKKSGTFETLVNLAAALEVEPYELLLPNSSASSYDTKKTRQLMKRLRSNVSDLLDTLDEYLKG